MDVKMYFVKTHLAVNPTEDGTSFAFIPFLTQDLQNSHFEGTGILKGFHSPQTRGKFLPISPFIVLTSFIYILRDYLYRFF